MLLAAANAYDAHLASLGLHDIDTHYSRVLVYKTSDQSSGRVMNVMVTDPHGKQSAMYIDDPTELAVRYTNFYKLAPHFMPGMKKVLMLGGGGYSFPKYAMAKYPNVEMDVVEIDPGITAIAKRFFELKEYPRLQIFHEDARIFLNRSGARYDVILGDTFNSYYSIPFHLSTIEAVKKLYDALSEDGVVLANTISAIEGDAGRFLRAEYATFKAVFPQVFLLPVFDPYNGSHWQNVMIVALKSTVKPSFQSEDPELNKYLDHLWKKPVPQDVPILTDDFAPVDRYVTLLE
jgi:spermidine synthase